jgi:hypothetical protein
MLASIVTVEKIVDMGQYAGVSSKLVLILGIKGKSTKVARAYQERRGSYYHGCGQVVRFDARRGYDRALEHSKNLRFL